MYTLICFAKVSSISHLILKIIFSILTTMTQYMTRLKTSHLIQNQSRINTMQIEQQQDYIQVCFNRIQRIYVKYVDYEECVLSVKYRSINPPLIKLPTTSRMHITRNSNNLKDINFNRNFLKNFFPSLIRERNKIEFKICHSGTLESSKNQVWNFIGPRQAITFK